MAIAKRKKRFFEAEIPLIGRTTDLLAYEIKELNNRIIKYDLTRLLRGKSAILQGKIKVEKEKATTIPIKITLLPYFLRRMMRKGTNYVESSFFTECKDKKVQIKPFLITRRKVSRAVRKALREKVQSELVNYLKEKTAEQIFEDILRNSIQKTISLKLKKIYPLSLCEIKVFRVVEEKQKEEIF